MNDLWTPLHLLVPTGVSVVLAIWMLLGKRRAAIKRERRWLWTCLGLCFVAYTLILLGVMWKGTRARWRLNAFDLNQDGLFSAAEQSQQQAEAMMAVSADTAHNFAFITGLIYAVILALGVYVFGLAFAKTKASQSSHFE